MQNEGPDIKKPMTTTFLWSIWVQTDRNIGWGTAQVIEHLPEMHRPGFLHRTLRGESRGVKFTFETQLTFYLLA